MNRRKPKPLKAWRGNPKMTREQYDRNMLALKYICSVAIRIYGSGPNAPIAIQWPEAQKLHLLQPNGLPLPKEIDDSLLYRRPGRTKTGARERARRLRQIERGIISAHPSA